MASSVENSPSVKKLFRIVIVDGNGDVPHKICAENAAYVELLPNTDVWFWSARSKADSHA